MVDKSLVMNVCEVYNQPLLDPILQKAFQYSLEGDLAPFSDGDYTIIATGHDILTCVFTKENVCQLDTAMYPTEKRS